MEMSPLAVMSNIAEELPRNPHTTIKIENVRQKTTVDFTKNIDKVVEQTSWIKKVEMSSGFGRGVHILTDSAQIRFYSSGQIDCIGYKSPITAYRAISESICDLQTEGLIENGDFIIKISNLSGSATLGRPVRLNKLYYQLPSSVNQIQPPEEESSSLNFLMTSSHINSSDYHHDRNIEAMNMRVSVYSTGKIQIKGARHPDMFGSAVDLILQMIDDECLV